MFNLTVVLILFFLLLLLLWSLKEHYQKGEGWNIKFIADEQGTGLLEYVLILILVGFVVILIVGYVGEGLGDVFSSVTSGM